MFSNAPLPMKDVDIFINHLMDVIAGNAEPSEKIISMFPQVTYTLVQEYRADPSRTASNLAALREYSKLYLKARDILKGCDLPDIPVHDGFSESETTELRDEIIELDKAGEVVKVRFQRLADVIAKKFNFVYLAEFGEFLIYDGQNGTWQDGAADRISALAKEVLGEACTTHYINEITNLIRIGSLIDPKEFGKLPDGLINLKNGVYDWKNKKLIKHSPQYHFRWVLPFGFNRHARRSRFFKVLEDIFKDDLKKALSTLEIFSWAFIPGYPIQTAAAFYGNGSNGKSTLIGTLAALLGQENIAGTPLQVLCENRFAVPGLRGKLANIAGDVGNSTLYDSSTFKRLTGDQYIEGEIKGLQRRPMFENQAKMIFAFNRLPLARDNSKAYYRRFFLIECIQAFEGQKDKKNLLTEITQEADLQAIFNMIADVFLPVLNETLGFTFNPQIEDTMSRYNLNANPALAFINETLEPDPDFMLETKWLYMEFVKWCEVRGISPVSDESFGLTLTKYSGMVVHTKLKQENGIRSRYYVGIRQKTDTDDMNKGNENNNDQGCDPTLITFTEALNYYIQKHKHTLCDQGDQGFSLPRTCCHESNIRVQKPYTPYTLSKESEKPNLENTASSESDQGSEKKPPTLITSDPEPDKKEADVIGKSQPEPTKSDVSSETEEKRPFTITDGDMIRDQLLSMGYLIDPSLSGLAMDNKHYKLAIRTPSHEKLERLLVIMAKSGFIQQNTGAMGSLFFAREVTP